MNNVHHKSILLFAATVLIFLSLYLFGGSMSKAISSDEQMYCTGGYLISKGLMPYRDFSYVAQLPYHPLLLAAVYKLTGTTHYLLAGRLVSVVFDILITICLFSIFRKVFAQHYFSGILLGLAGCVLFVFNPFVSQLLGLAWNHDMAMLCIVLSFRIFLSCEHTTEQGDPKIRNFFLKDFSTPSCSAKATQDFGRNDNGHHHINTSKMTTDNTMRIFVIASLLTIAAWTRATSVFVVPVFFAIIIYSAWASVFAKATTNKKAHPTFTSLFVMISGVIVLSILPVYIILQSGRAFFLNIVTIPILNSELLHNLHIAYGKCYLTITAFRNKEFLFLILTAAFVCFCVFGHSRLLRRLEHETSRNDIKNAHSVIARESYQGRPRQSQSLLAILLLITSIIIAYFPPTIWKQYFGIPVIFVIIVTGFALRYLRELPPFIFTYKTCSIVFLTLSITTMISQKPITKISKCFQPDDWTPLKIHNIAKQIVARAATSKIILTLSPLYSIEGGGEIYTELAAGAFAFRVADKLSENDKAITKTAGVKDLQILVKSAGAVVIGGELTRFEKIDLKSIVPPDWQRINCGSTSVHSFFPPDTELRFNIAD